MFNGYKGGGWHDKPAGRMALNAISIPSVPHTVRVPAELRDLVAAAVERGELAPGEVAGTLQRAMRCGLAAALETEAMPGRTARRARTPRPTPAAVAAARIERAEGVARAVAEARAHLARGGSQRGAVEALNGLGLLNTRRLVAVPWTVFSLARALSMP